MGRVTPRWRAASPGLQDGVSTSWVHEPNRTVPRHPRAHGAARPGYTRHMGTLEIVWGISVIVTFWFLPIGAIRMIAYASGEVDHTPGMRNLALATLGTGVVAAVVMVGLTIAVATT